MAERFQVRLTAGLRDRIRAMAEANGRSMNTEIVSTLESAYPDPAQFREELGFLDAIDEIQQKLDRLRSVQIAEASQNFSDGFVKENATKLRGRRAQGTDEDEE